MVTEAVSAPAALAAPHLAGPVLQEDASDHLGGLRSKE